MFVAAGGSLFRHGSALCWLFCTHRGKFLVRFNRFKGLLTRKYSKIPGNMTHPTQSTQLIGELNQHDHHKPSWSAIVLPMVEVNFRRTHPHKQCYIDIDGHIPGFRSFWSLFNLEIEWSFSWSFFLMTAVEFRVFRSKEAESKHETTQTYQLEYREYKYNNRLSYFMRKYS